MLLPIPNDLPALTLTYTFSSLSNYPTADLSVQPRTNELPFLKLSLIISKMEMALADVAQ